MHFNTLLPTSLLAMAIGLASFTADAAQRIQLQYNGTHLRGQETLFLKRKLQQQTGMSAQGLQLKGVILVAKSKHGRGQAVLRVGQAYSRTSIIGGTPFDFHRRGGFDRIRIRNPKHNSNGPWQIQLRGNIKIRKVVLIVQQRAMRVPLQLYGQQFNSRGGNDTIMLKRLARQQTGVNLQNYDLMRVVLVAKTRHGRGQAHLRVGQAISPGQVVNGNPYDFNGRGGYDRVVLQNPKHNSNGPWQIKMRGNFKVQRAVLILQPKY